MKTKIIPAILACSAILASANMVPASTQTPAVAPAPLHPYPAYPQAMPPQDYFNGLPKKYQQPNSKSTSRCFYC